MSASLVGSEMCIRDRLNPCPGGGDGDNGGASCKRVSCCEAERLSCGEGCLLYTSDAADDM
eukprot:9921327-Alexandrium_andersonii.AAC.1